jgi:2-methylcitrate dehydratase PrpD
MAPVDTPTRPNVTARLTDRLLRIRRDQLPPSIVTRARMSILDWAGVTVAGAAEPAARIAAECALGEVASGPCSLVGRAERTSAQQAALVNGVASHALDFDDGSYWMMGHPSVAVVPAALALAEATGASEATLLPAVVAGVEAASAVGVLVGKGHYMAGWHATGTIGTFGAAAAAAHILDLDPHATRCALGLAATQAAALKVMNGTMGKPFHAGRAAMNGVLAAQLAAAGFQVSDSAIEGPQGFASTATNAFDETAVESEIGERYGMEAVSYKRHACCGGTHGVIDSIARLRRDVSFTAADLEQAVLEVSPMTASMCVVDVPSTGLEGKFSLRYCAALALLGRSTGPSSFTDVAVRDPATTEVVRKIRTKLMDERSGPVVDLRLHLRDKRVLEARSDPAQPNEAVRVPRIADEELPEWQDALERKFHDLADPVLGCAVAGQVVDVVGRLGGDRSVKELASLLSSPHARVAED